MPLILHSSRSNFKLNSSKIVSIFHPANRYPIIVIPDIQIPVLRFFANLSYHERNKELLKGRDAAYTARTASFDETPPLPFQTMTRRRLESSSAESRHVHAFQRQASKSQLSLSLCFFRHASLTSFFDSYSAATSLPPRITLRDVIILRATCSFHSRLFSTFIPRPLLFDLIPPTTYYL